MYDLIPIVIILLCLAGIIAIVVKKLPLLSVFDVNSIPEEKEAETKKKIMEERMGRKLKHLGNKLKPYAQLLGSFLRRKVKASQDKIAQLEEKYKSKAKREVLITQQEFQSLENRISMLLAEAEALSRDEEYNAAEKKYIEILSLDSKNIPAYRGLANLYLSQKMFEETAQTYKHILKLNKNDSQTNFDLAELMVRLEDYQSAENSIIKAVASEPIRPKYLDLWLIISIKLKNKEMAREALERLKAVNPENAKIAEFETQIKTL